MTTHKTVLVRRKVLTLLLVFDKGRPWCYLE